MLLGLLGRRFGRAVGWVAVFFEVGALVSGFYVALAEMGAALPYHDQSFVWLNFPGGTRFVMGTLVSPLGALMLLVINVVGLLVVLYSNEYMAHEEGLPRYYAELMLFLSAMNALVLADNYLEFILFWELVGLCSYLLIGFFYKKPEAASAAKKAFLVTRVGDVLFLAGVFIFFASFAGVHGVGPITSYPGTACPSSPPGTGPTWACSGFVFAPPNANSAAPFLAPGTVTGDPSGTLMTLAGLLILGGAAGKSAQFPLHTWLPDAMEGPTTVSALIHAATMVAAGIFLLAITTIYLGFTPTAALVILGVGGFTSLFAGTMGLVSPDIKRVIAYSTISQLGYMTMAVGAAAYLVVGPGAAMFHLFTHAFFKSLLFLAAGSVIHVVGTQDLFKMGGLRKAMPITAGTMLVGALALSGIFPFSGFFSKDDLLSLTYSATSGVPLGFLFFALSVAAVLLTALYIFRLWFMTFGGEGLREPPAPHPGGHPSPKEGPGASPSPLHEPSWVMLAPLVTLAAITCVAGFLPLIPSFAHLFPGLTWSIFGYSKVGGAWTFSLSDLALSLLSLSLAFLGLGIAWVFWGGGRVYRMPTGSPLRGLHGILQRRYYFDDAYDALAVHGILVLSKVMDWVDRYVIDGTVHGFEQGFSRLSSRVRTLQTGIVSNYALWLVTGLLVLVIFFLYGVPYLAPLFGGG